MTAGRAVGIDLGTTNSVVAVIDRDGAPRILTTEVKNTPVVGWIARNGGVHAIGLAAPAHPFGVVVHVFGIEHIDAQALAMSQIGQQLVIAAGGLHADGAARGPGFEPGLDGAALVGQGAAHAAAVHAEEHNVFTGIHTDVQGGG